MTDWRAWHGHYDDEDSSLSRRLQVVQRLLDGLVDGDQVRRVLTLCAGDGRDILPVLAGKTQRPDVVLVELDPDLAAAAGRLATETGVDAAVLVGDAGASQTWHDLVPVDLLMLCGIFGNIRDRDIRTTIDAARGMVTHGGSVIWTRGYLDEVDLRPQIRTWFTEAGFTETAFEAEPIGYGVGVNRWPSDTLANAIPDRLFSFVR